MSSLESCADRASDCGVASCQASLHVAELGASRTAPGPAPATRRSGRPSAGPRPRRRPRRSGRSGPGRPAARRPSSAAAGFGFGRLRGCGGSLAVRRLVLAEERLRPLDLLRRRRAAERQPVRGRDAVGVGRPCPFSSRSASASDCRRTNGELSRNSAWPGTVVASRRAGDERLVDRVERLQRPRRHAAQQRQVDAAVRAAVGLRRGSPSPPGRCRASRPSSASVAGEPVRARRGRACRPRPASRRASPRRRAAAGRAARRAGSPGRRSRCAVGRVGAELVRPRQHEVAHQLLDRPAVARRSGSPGGRAAPGATACRR